MVEALEQYAQEHHVPIMKKEGIVFLKQYILEHDVTSILEIGTAIGYSAIQMALVNDTIHVTTIERDIKRYQEAIQNIAKFGLQDRITVIYGDALEVDIVGTFDLIFIDAAKGQNIRFFTKFESKLRPQGTIITDNIDFHGLVNSEEKLSRNLRQLTRKIKEYISFLEENTQYHTTFYHIGDGISVSVKEG